MSTKIYDGLIATRRNAFKVQRDIKAVIEPIFFDKFDQAAAALDGAEGNTWAETIKDVLWSKPHYGEFGYKPVGKPTSYGTRSDLYELIVLLKNDPFHTFTELDFGYDVVLLPNGEGLEWNPLVLLFSERSGDEYRKALISAGVVREYGYWNNTDSQDGVSDDEWRRRERAWSKLNVPADDGLSFRMPGEYETVWAKR